MTTRSRKVAVDRAILRARKANRRIKGTFAGVVGLRFEALGPDRVVATVPIRKALKQPWGIVHGGVLMTLADTAAGAGSFVYCGKGETTVTLEMKVWSPEHPRTKGRGTNPKRHGARSKREDPGGRWRIVWQLPRSAAAETPERRRRAGQDERVRRIGGRGER